MITLEQDRLVFRFPNVHEDAHLEVEFQRTLRIPDDGRSYPLPPGLGRFPLRHVDDFAGALPAPWSTRGGVMLPMYQAEALWINFRSPDGYPMLAKVAAGKINAVTGQPWSEDVTAPPEQDYLVAPGQPWLDGYCTEKGVIRQFVAMPLGAGYSPEEQLGGKAEFGGLQLVVFPIKAEKWERMKRAHASRTIACTMADSMLEAGVVYSAAPDMALGMGGRMTQEIYEDRFALGDWDLTTRSRCFVHLANSLVWRAITGQEPPATPATAAEYTKHGLPWFDYYADAPALGGARPLRRVKSIVEKAAEKGDVPLPENESVEVANVKKLGTPRPKNVVREGTF